jgi:hypothetical protein
MIAYSSGTGSVDLHWIIASDDDYQTAPSSTKRSGNVRLDRQMILTRWFLPDDSYQMILTRWFLPDDYRLINGKLSEYWIRIAPDDWEKQEFDQKITRRSARINVKSPDGTQRIEIHGSNLSSVTNQRIQELR